MVGDDDEKITSRMRVDQSCLRERLGEVRIIAERKLNGRYQHRKLGLTDVCEGCGEGLEY